MIRIFVVFLAMIIAVRLLSIIIRSIRAYSRGNVEHKKKSGGEVGEGWIVEDRENNENKADQ